MKRAPVVLLAMPGVAIALIVVLLVAMVGGRFSNPADATDLVPGTGDLKVEAVPDWARAWVIKAARTCPEITGPLLAAQLDQESAWKPDARSPAGAEGLAQFMPGTWATWGIDGDGDGTANPFTPADAIMSQARYMCGLVAILKTAPGLSGEIVDLALAAYNAGPQNVLDCGGIPPFPETQKYVPAIRRLATEKYSKTLDQQGTLGNASAVIEAAHAKIGTPYSWGGGTLDGPSQGGFDCSGLVRYAYFQGTGHTITLPRTSQDQYTATRGHTVPLAQLQPGDLLFWGGPNTIHHVALYIGNNQMIEAPETGQTVHQTVLRTNGDFAAATRVFSG